MLTSKYVYLSSSSFVGSTHVTNQPFDFTSDILYPLSLDVNKWEVALTEISWPQRGKEFTDDLYIMSDIVNNTIQVGSYFPHILRIVNKPTVFVKPYYVPIVSSYISSIRIYVRLENSSSPPKEIMQNMRCTLHFREKGISC